MTCRSPRWRWSCAPAPRRTPRAPRAWRGTRWGPPGADVVAWAERALAADDLILGFSGDVEAAQAARLAGLLVDGLPRGAPPPALPAAAAARRGRRTFLINKPERAQSQILVGHPAPP